ncbi:uncharacterized protein A1O5_08624 [Cladophialophora psammophila CBS 110553]|uniref:Transcription factor domain-containing protein n=1 Tax=Cladophialophora psammophila CBS 110553 TaxID=1182543 RepID=W9XC52_9EURO|nr:uncharacterized protein A1O5_08624 [Cladophialophora psammophila CBS 110553]EXJ68009.1 hypothetical protein A1O5_08624 [Cladophialophora psammophila CBS 110553]
MDPNIESLYLKYVSLLPGAQSESDGSERDALTAIDPAGFLIRHPPKPHELDAELTDDSQLFQTIHMGAAVVDENKWKLVIDGLVERPFSVSFAQLKSMPCSTITAFHECYGSPIAPPVHALWRIGNIKWTGVRLADMLELAKPKLEARYVWSQGLESGSFAGVSADRYEKDLPLEKALSSEVLIAYEMNGEPLSKNRGGPVRMVVPGYFGTNSTKWLCRLSLQDRRAIGPFTTIFYNEIDPTDPGGQRTRPVWMVEPNSMIVRPEPESLLQGPDVEIRGRAWGCEEISQVDVSIDGGECWLPRSGVSLRARSEFEWQKSTELEEEINKLKRQLSVYEDNVLTNLAAPSVPDRVVPSLVEDGGPQDDNDRCMNEDSRDLSDPLKNRIFSTTVPVGMSPDSPNGACLPGATTIPKGSLLDTRSTSKGRVISSRNLRDIELSKEVINELFRIYFSHYHAYLPFLDPGISPAQYCDSSTLLFWSIISVASRRYQADPTLLTRLARAVTDLLWKSLQTEPHSLGVIQSLVLLCTWPFPTSSSTTDPTYTLSGMIIQLSIQMGLHRPRSPLDFTKFRVNLSPHDVEDRRRTWIASNIVTQSISFGVGLPTPAQLCDWSIVAASLEGPRIDEDLHAHLRCASTCNRISQALASNASDPMGLLPTRERLPLYTILNQEIIDLEISRVWTPATTAFYFHVVKLHLHAFYLFDEPTALGYLERIVALYSTATSVIEHVRNLDSRSQDFLRFCPLFCYEAFLCAVFILLKVVKNDYFAAIIDADSGKGLINFSVSALRKISVVNNDLPGRLSDVIAYLWTHPNPSLMGGIGMDGLQLKVRSRMSMSIVYDSLWRWREQFRTEAESADPQGLNNGNTPPVDAGNRKLISNRCTCDQRR